MAKGGLAHHLPTVSNCGEQSKEVPTCLSSFNSRGTRPITCTQLFQSDFRLVRMAEVWAKEVATVVTLSSSVEILKKKNEREVLFDQLKRTIYPFMTKHVNNKPFLTKTVKNTFLHLFDNSYFSILKHVFQFLANFLDVFAQNITV